MRKFSQSAKSQKTVGSMIIDPKKKQAEKLSSQNKSAKGKENKSPITEELKAGSNGETLSNDSNKTYVGTLSTSSWVAVCDILSSS